MKANIKTNNPLAFIKVYTTGGDFLKDRIIELSVIKFETGKEPVKVSRRYNPGGVAISEEAREIHGITDADVKGSPLFESKAKGLVEFLKGCDLVGFNVRDFDLPFLSEEFARCGESFVLYNRKIVDLFSVYKQMNERTFESAVKQYLNQETSKNISSGEYLVQSVELMNSMMINEIDRIKDVSIESLSERFNPKANALDAIGNIVFNENKRPVFNFGKNKGKVVSEVCEEDPNYFNWLTIDMANKLPRDTINIIKGIFARSQKTTQQ